MASHNGRLFSKWAWSLLIMASMASALSFTNIQPIVAPSVPLGCILAYGVEIPGCSINDFQEDVPCSESCVRGLTRAQYLLQAACGDADVSPASVLGQVLMGNTVQMLCPGNARETPTPSPSRRPTAEPTTITVPVTRTSSRGPLTLTTVRSSSTTSATATETETETETDESDTSTSTSSATSTAAPDEPTPTTVIDSSTSVGGPATSATPTEVPEETVENSSGGGSPFDFVSSDSRKLPTGWREATAVALGLGLLLLR